MNILLLGSGPEVTVCRSWALAPFDRVVAINNAWRVRPDWDAVIHAYDFPTGRLPDAPGPGQRIVTEAEFVPAMNAFGGVVHVGATMAFTATCWVLHHYRPRVVAYLGCDMHYPPGRTHFYGRGRADPLRPDVTLRSLEAKAARAMVLAAAKGTALVNLSHGPSRLVFPRATRASVAAGPVPRRYDRVAAARALGREAALGYRVPSGRHWLEAERFDPRALAEVDALWLAAAVEPDRLAPAS
jgi:hypothetical protein